MLGIGNGLARELDLPPEEVTVGQILAGTMPRAGDAPRRSLRLGSQIVATVSSDAGKLTPISALSAEGMPVAEVLAAMAASHPSGLLVFDGAANDGASTAFAVESGRVVGGTGSARWGRLELWIAEVHRRFPERFEASHAEPWVAQGREFVRELFIEALDRSAHAGCRMVFLRGDVEWSGARLRKDDAPALEHLLLEQARRTDEMPRLLAQLDDLRRMVVPASAPGSDPAAGHRDAREFEDDGDEATTSAWNDVGTLWSLVDGQTSGDELVDAAMLGRYRGVKALATLLAGGHVRLDEKTRRFSPLPPHAEERHASVIPLPTAPRHARRPSVSTEYSLVRGSQASSREHIHIRTPPDRTASSGPAFARVTRKYPLQSAASSAPQGEARSASASTSAARSTRVSVALDRSASSLARPARTIEGARAASSPSMAEMDKIVTSLPRDSTSASTSTLSRAAETVSEPRVAASEPAKGRAQERVPSRARVDTRRALWLLLASAVMLLLAAGFVLYASLMP